MLKTKVIPCLLLKNLGLVKTVKFREPKYVGDPINAVKIFNEKETDELVFLDITATIEKRSPNLKLLSQIASEAFIPFSYGGGLRTLEDIKKILQTGVEKIIINSYAFENPEFIKEAAKAFGSQSIVVSIDVKKNIWGKYEVFTHSGQKNTKVAPVQYALEMKKMGAGEIFLNSIERDGTRKGYDLNLIEKVSKAVDIPVVACGGAGKIEDFKKAIRADASAVSAGSLFVFMGPHRAVLINYPAPEELEKILNQ